MCGIAGSVWWDGRDDSSAVTAMCNAIAHRGPDAQGLWRHQGATLGHRRLSILDTSADANQPMIDEEAGLAVVFNGEIYNFRSLRRELEALGECFRTTGDTEILLKAYARWGMAAIERFNGMFAFALWDFHHRRLLLARDRLGKKPLFFRRTDLGVVFASELKALRLHPATPHAIDPMAMGQYLAMNYVLGDRCILSGVEKLPPGHWLMLHEGSDTQPNRYWDLASHFHTKARFASVDEAAEAVGELLDDAIALRLESDVPLGAFLSGGLDSAAITEGMRRLNPNGRVDTFTIAFREKGFNELDQAAHTAQCLGLTQHAHTVDADAAHLLPTLVEHADEPFADTSMIPVWHLSQMARRHVTVALSGDGGDEIFAGYPTYVADKLWHMSRWVPPAMARLGLAAARRLLPPSFGKIGADYKIKQFLSGHALPFPRAHLWWRGIFSTEDMTAMLRPHMRAEIMAEDPFAPALAHFDPVVGCHPVDQASYVDIKTWLPDDILVKVDRMTMAHGLEARAPLLDYRMVELAASLPPDFKLNGFDKKHVFKRVLAQRLPPAILNRPKAGFNAPVAHWLAGPMAPLARSVLEQGALSEWVDPGFSLRLLDEHVARRHDHGFRLFGLLCLGLWLDHHAAMG